MQTTDQNNNTDDAYTKADTSVVNSELEKSVFTGLDLSKNEDCYYEPEKG